MLDKSEKSELQSQELCKFRCDGETSGGTLRR